MLSVILQCPFVLCLSVPATSIISIAYAPPILSDLLIHQTVYAEPRLHATIMHHLVRWINCFEKLFPTSFLVCQLSCLVIK